MTTDPLTVDDNPDARDVSFLEDRLNEYNIRTTGMDDGRLVSIFLRDEAGQMFAGLYGWTWGGTCEIRFLWVREDQRGQDLGTRLMRAAEAEAVRRGCRQIVLDTHDFQAPGFYRKLGFAIEAVQEDYPVGHKKYYLRKRLAR